LDELAVIVEPSVETRDNSGNLINKTIFKGLMQLEPNPVSEVVTQSRVEVFDSFTNTSGSYVAILFRSVEVSYPLHIGDK
jgi:hypothetical protein